jgi:hypothetical protein
MTERDRLLASLLIASEEERDAALDVLAFILERLDAVEAPGLTGIDPAKPFTGEPTIGEVLRGL